MPAKVPAFPLLGEPGEWDVLTLLAATIFLEAEGEPFEGQLGVGWVIRHRVERWGQSWHQAILGPEGRAWDDGRPWEAFSCWNDDYRIRARARLDTAGGEPAETAWRAAAGALWAMLPDPVGGATFYLNVELTRRLRGGSLPAWADLSKTTAVIGRHTFLGLG